MVYTKIKFVKTNPVITITITKVQTKLKNNIDTKDQHSLLSWFTLT